MRRVLDRGEHPLTQFRRKRGDDCVRVHSWEDFSGHVSAKDIARQA